MPTLTGAEVPAITLLTVARGTQAPDTAPSTRHQHKAPRPAPGTGAPGTARSTSALGSQAPIQPSGAARLGRLRRLLRLGERADDGASGCAVLDAVGGGRRRTGAGAGLRNRTDRASGRPQRDAHGGHRSVGADALAGADSGAPRASGPPGAPGARRHPASAVSRLATSAL